MKKNFFIISVSIVIFFILFFLLLNSLSRKNTNNNDIASISESNEDSNNLPEEASKSNEDSNGLPEEASKLNNNSVSYNGWLQTKGSKLENEKGEPVQLRGVSSHGIEWFSNVITFENLQELKNNWNVNVFRIAMYTNPDGYGYIASPEINKNTVYKIVDMAINLDMYVIVDWHILNDNNPQIHKEDAKEFFNELSSKYANVPNLIYEICNEPNGNSVTWNNDVKPYSEEIIPIIRSHSEKALIIVGTPDWCKNLQSPADNPLNFKNIAYSLHFYSGSHGAELQNQINYCMKKNIPVFVSECGLTDASGNGNVYFNEFKEWINYLNINNISWIYWSFSNKNESSAILLNSYIPNTTTEIKSDSSGFSSNTIGDNSNEINDINNYLTEAGKFIKNIFLSY
ncbi:MAG: glycoside hydrolase family 5 protein [Clostridia bacterium]|nr:glycoside hydrolase family 5 protein [Clostridia bacterium]